MHSHMYFYAEDARPDWSSPPPGSPQALAREAEITEALCAVVPYFKVMPRDAPGAGTWLYLSPLDQVTVYADHVHWDIKYRGSWELNGYGTMPILRATSRVLHQFGFDFFENGCQGLDQRGDIEEMPNVLAGMYEPEWAN